MDEAAKKRTLRMIPYALYVVGTRRAEVSDPQEDLNAFIGSWVSQCSFDPPLVMFGLKRGTRGHEMIKASGVFTLNVLAADQKDVAVRFFKDVTITDETMAEFPYELGPNTEAPVLPDLAAWVECEVIEVHEDGGDHDVVVGRVLEAHHADGTDEPLTHASTGWHYGG